MSNVTHVSVKKLADAVGAEANARANAVSAETRRAKSAEDALNAAVEKKVDKVAGKGLSESNFTQAEKTKLEGIEVGAQVNPLPVGPSAATAEGAFADAKLTFDLINEIASTNSAHYLTADADGTPFATAANLRSALASHTEADPKFFYAGAAFTPTKNDWVIVQEDEEHPLGTIIPSSRWGFVGVFGGGGSFQFQVSYKLPLTPGQIAALNSGITGAIVNWLLSFKGGDRTTTLDYITNALGNRLKLSGGILTGGLEIRDPEGLTLGRTYQQQLQIDAFKFTIKTTGGESIVLTIPLHAGTLALTSDIPDITNKLDKDDVVPQSSVTDQTPAGKAADARDLKSRLDCKRNKNDYSATSFSAITYGGVEYTEWKISTVSGRLALAINIDGVWQNIAIFNSQTGVFMSAAYSGLLFDGKAPTPNVWPTVKDVLARISDLNGKQDKINDLETIRAGARLGSQALPSEYEARAVARLQWDRDEQNWAILQLIGGEFYIGDYRAATMHDLAAYLPDSTPAYSASATYAVGAFAKHGGALYVCKTAITTAEAWTPAHWTAMPNVSALFSAANTANDAANINYTATGETATTVKAKIQSIETAVGTANGDLEDALNGTEEV